MPIQLLHIVLFEILPEQLRNYNKIYKRHYEE